MVANVYADVWVIAETHATKDNELQFDNYVVYQHNRTSNLSKKGSGGIAIAINNSLFESHELVKIVRGVDGQIGIKLRNQLNDMQIGVLGLYLSPDSYRFGQDPEQFFNEAAIIWEDFRDCDLLVGTGDLNARIRSENDFIEDIDGHIPPRINPDSVKNPHGNHFLTFLKGNRAIVLNGSVSRENNNFKFHSPRCRSVPDHMFCPTDQFSYCKKM